MLDERLRGPCDRHGLALPDRALAPGLSMRLDDVERPDEGDGYLFLFADGMGGFIQNHRRPEFPKGEPFFFDGSRPSELTPEQREAARRARREARELRESLERQAKVACEVIWNNAGPASADHPYLARKRSGWIAQHLRQVDKAPSMLSTWRRMAALTFPLLIVPGYGPNRDIQALEYIDANGTKLFHPQAKQEGAMIPLGWRHDAPHVLVAEGITTAASLAEATGNQTFAAFSAGNLENVARWVVQNMPASKLCICGDDDGDDRVDRYGRKIGNKGVQKAREAAKAVGAHVVFPGEPKCDFNDIYVREGGAEVRRLLDLAEKGSRNQEPAAGAFTGDLRNAVNKLRGEEIRFDDLIGVHDQEKIFNVRSGRFLTMGVVDRAVSDIYGSSRASKSVMMHRGVSSAVWAPGEPIIVEDKRLMDDVAWQDDDGARQLNLYRGPRVAVGDAKQARPWLDHIGRLYPDTEIQHHLLAWFAHRRQKPSDKINHALVLGGGQGAGKDTMLEPIKASVGPWNFKEASPRDIIHPQFNPYVRAIVLRVNEARDMGESDRYRFYEQMKTLCAAPPDVLMMSDKHLRAIPVLNCVGVIFTTNHKVGGMHLAPDDRRHFVAWTDLTKEDWPDGYFDEFYSWLTMGGGYAHCAAYLDAFDLTKWNSKTPPPKTDAFWEMVLADAPQETGDLGDVLRHMGDPDALSFDAIKSAAQNAGKAEFVEWAFGADARKHRKAFLHRLEEAGYGVTKNDAAQDGRWTVAGQNIHIYTRRKLDGKRRYAIAQTFAATGIGAKGNVVSIFSSSPAG